MYISKKEYGGECLDISVDPDMDITEYGIGTQVTVTATGVVKSARAPYKGEDYSEPYDSKKPRKMKTHPGRLEIDLEGKPSLSATPKPVVSGIANLTAMMDADEAGDDY